MVKGFFGQLGRRGGGGPQMVRGGGVKPLFVRVEGRKHQVRHNTGVWALDTAWLCVCVRGGTANRGEVKGGGVVLILLTFYIHAEKDRVGERKWGTKRFEPCKFLETGAVSSR